MLMNSVRDNQLIILKSFNMLKNICPKAAFETYLISKNFFIFLIVKFFKIITFKVKKTPLIPIPYRPFDPKYGCFIELKLNFCSNDDRYSIK